LKAFENYTVIAGDAGATPSLAATDSATNFIGTDDNDNAAATTNVAANEDGTILERLEQIQEGINKGAGQALPAAKSLFDIIGETYTDDGGADHLDDVASHLNLISKYIADGDGDCATGQALPSNKSLFDIIGETYTDDAGADHLDDVYSHINLLMTYTGDGDGAGGAGATLPSGKSLFDIIGETYTDDGGADHLDDVASHINLLSKYIADGDGDWATGTALASDKSIADALGTNGSTLVDDAASIAGMIGYDDADNAMATSSVVANTDGSVYERLEYIQAGMIGSYLIVTVTVDSNCIPNNTQTAGDITGAASGTLLLVEISVNTDSTGWATPTNIEFTTDNVSGLTGAAAPFGLEVVGSFAANKTWNLSVDGDTKILPIQIESGKKVFIHGDDGAGTGDGEGIITLVFQRVTAGATIAGNDLTG